MSAPAAVSRGWDLPQNRTGEDRRYTRSMNHPGWLIPPPLDGSFGYLTFTQPGEGRVAFRLDSESQEDSEGPQLTSSDRRSPVRPAAATFYACPVPGTRRRRNCHVRCTAARRRGAS